MYENKIETITFFKTTQKLSKNLKNERNVIFLVEKKFGTNLVNLFVLFNSIIFFCLSNISNVIIILVHPIIKKKNCGRHIGYIQGTVYMYRIVEPEQ